MEQQATISVEDNVIRCRGSWTLPNLSQLEQRGRALRWPDTPTVLYDAGEVTAMDTGGALILQRCIDGVRRKGQQTALQGLKPEFDELLRKVEVEWSRPEGRGARSRDELGGDVSRVLCSLGRCPRFARSHLSEKAPSHSAER